MYMCFVVPEYQFLYPFAFFKCGDDFEKSPGLIKLH